MLISSLHLICVALERPQWLVRMETMYTLGSCEVFCGHIIQLLTLVCCYFWLTRDIFFTYSFRKDVFITCDRHMLEKTKLIRKKVSRCSHRDCTRCLYKKKKRRPCHWLGRFYKTSSRGEEPQGAS